jgi:cell division protein FtsB|tara:strand:+ start:206 stop:616 length:411 start_codon:yes stop_codon:yes gene_type:complete
VSINHLHFGNTTAADGQSKKALDIAKEERRLRQTRTRRMIFGVVSLLTSILILNALIGEQGVVSVMRARTERTALETVMDSLRKENHDLRQLADALRTDPSTIERVARDDLGLIAPGEQVLIVGEPRLSDQIAPTQ